MAAAGVYAKSQAPSYESHVVLQLALPQGQNQQATTPTTTPQLATSHQVAAAAAKALALPTATVQSCLDATIDPSSFQVTISCTTEHPQESQRIADAAATAYVGALTQQVNAQIATLTRQQETLKSQINSLDAQLKADSTNSLLSQQLNDTLNTYGQVNSQLIALQSAPPPAAVTQQATPGTSTNPHLTKVLGLGALIGLVAGCGIALLRDHFDTRVRASVDVEQVMDTPVLAELPDDRESARGVVTLPVVDNARSSFGQAVRDLRTSLQVLVDDIPCPVLVVTSPEPFDGKTFVSANLAASWARSGKRVVVVSGDLRKPRIERLLGAPSGAPGLAELIGGSSNHRRGKSPAPVPAAEPVESDVGRSLVDTAIAGLRLLPPGGTALDPSDLLAEHNAELVFEHLRTMADVVIVDTPPVLAVADATILASYADGVLLVVTAQKTNEPLLELTARRLHAAHVTLLGTTINRSAAVANRAYSAYYANES